MRILLNIGVLIAVALGTWWLTGKDKTYAGDSKRDRHLTRALRCVAVVFLTLVFFGPLEHDMGFAGVPIMFIAPMGIAIVLRSSLSEIFAGGFVGMLDPALHDHRAQDPQKAARYQDAIAHFIRNGQRDEAIRLCEELKISGEVDIMTVNHTLAYLGVKTEQAAASPLHEAARLRAGGKLAEAEQLLRSLLLKKPADEGAAMMLMRLYAQDLHQPQQAHEVLQALAKQPHVPASHLEFARRSIQEWNTSPPAAPAPAALDEPKSIDDWVAQGSFGTAVELLEAQIAAGRTLTQ